MKDCAGLGGASRLTSSPTVDLSASLATIHCTATMGFVSELRYARMFLMPFGMVILMGAIALACVHYQEMYCNRNLTEELEATKRRLEIMLECREHTEKLLADTQREQQADKDRLKEMVNSCLTMTQQSVACQNQLEALQTRCKKTRADCAKIVKERDYLRSAYNST